MGCYWDEANSQDQGCINTIDYKVYGGLVREEYLQLCYDQQRCNQKNRGEFNGVWGVCERIEGVFLKLSHFIG